MKKAMLLAVMVTWMTAACGADTNTDGPTQSVTAPPNERVVADSQTESAPSPQVERVAVSAQTETVAASSTEPVNIEGKYELINPPQPTSVADKIEVMEFFWYGCSHCYDLETPVHEWLGKKPDDVEFVRYPAVPGDNWALLAQAYFTAEALGVLEKTHKPLFDAIHKDEKPFANEKQLEEFFASQGVDAETFRSAWRSFAVVTKVNRAKLTTRQYGISSVPTLVVNGKYRLTSRLAGSTQEMFKVVDVLVQQERSAAKSKAAALATP